MLRRKFREVRNSGSRDMLADCDTHTHTHTHSSQYSAPLQGRSNNGTLMTRPCNQLRHERVTDCYAGSAQHTIVNKAQSSAERCTTPMNWTVCSAPISNNCSHSYPHRRSVQLNMLGLYVGRLWRKSVELVTPKKTVPVWNCAFNGETLDFCGEARTRLPEWWFYYSRPNW